MMKTRDQALVYVTATILVFLVIAIVGGGWPKAAIGNNEEVLKQAVITYYERMPEHLYKIPEAELKQLLDKGAPDLFLVDLRSAADYAAGHIVGASNIPFQQVGQNLDKLPRDKTIIVYCYTGQTGGQTTATLNLAGFKARSLNGGMNNGWLKAGYPVVR
ncbi:MAG TPA: hypothetical protein DD734_08740 [Firmicutes bacterium]|nr:hypothetical protein [Bacillota bacterium]